MRRPAQGATGGWVMPGLVFRWFPVCEFSLSDAPWGEFSGGLGSCSQCSHSKGSNISGQERRFHKWFVMALSKIKTNIQKPKMKPKMNPRQMAGTKSGKQ